MRRIDPLNLITKRRLAYYHNRIKNIFASKTEVEAIEDRLEDAEDSIDAYEQVAVTVTRADNTTKTYDMLIRKANQSQGG